ncbi:MAG: hypothetical protein JXA13_10615 [Anaerolineales bacterium]|nr:hypothetical protein [Anaerolineales bacterium]
MLSQISYLRTAIKIPYHHHARWDGKGYPEGVQGDSLLCPDILCHRGLGCATIRPALAKGLVL